MEFLAMLYTVLLVAICLMMALLLFRSGRPTGGLDEADCEELNPFGSNPCRHLPTQNTDLRTCSASRLSPHNA